MTRTKLIAMACLGVAAIGAAALVPVRASGRHPSLVLRVVHRSCTRRPPPTCVRIGLGAVSPLETIGRFLALCRTLRRARPIAEGCPGP